MSVSWRNIFVNDKLFLIKTLFQDDCYEILFSSLTTGDIFYEQLLSSDVSERNQKLNPTIEMPVGKLLHHLSDIFNCNQDGIIFENVVSGLHSSVCSLKLTTILTMVGVPFVWEFSLFRVKSKILCEHLIKPLMIMCSELLRRQHTLYSLLHSKDRELEDLKAQAIQVTKRKLETKTFDEANFCHEREKSPGRENVIKRNGNTAFSYEGQRLYENITAVLMQESCKESHSALTKQGVNESEICSSASHSYDIAQSHHKEFTQASPGKIQTEETELQRRLELEKRLAEKSENETKKKKKKLKL